MRSREIKPVLVIAVAGLLTASCTRSIPNQIICDRLQGTSTGGYTDTGYQSESKLDYEWQPVIKIDNSNKTVLFAVSHDQGGHAAHPKIYNFTQNSGVLRFQSDPKDFDAKYFLDLNQMNISFSSYISEDGYWSNLKMQAACRPLKKMPELIY